MNLRVLLKNFFRTAIAVGLLVIVLEVLLWAHPPIVAFAMAWSGHSPLCPSADAYRGLARHQALHKHEGEIRKASHRVRTEGALALWETPDGQYWIPSNSENVLPILLAQQASRIYGDGEAGIRRGDVVLDCGAHVGVYTRVALKAGAQTVVAIEPAPDNVECLRRNFLKEIAAGRVIVAAKGVWDKEDILPLYEDPGNSAADSFVMPGVNAKVTHKIPLTRIDTLVAELHLPKITVVKMDIKGATLRALEGGRQTLLRDHPRIALSTEEAEDDPGNLSRYLAAQYQYRPRCGVCSLDKATLEPEVMLYQ